MSMDSIDRKLVWGSLQRSANISEATYHVDYDCQKITTAIIETENAPTTTSVTHCTAEGEIFATALSLSYGRMRL